jgi:hypothetical protein
MEVEGVFFSHQHRGPENLPQNENRLKKTKTFHNLKALYRDPQSST